MGYPSSNTASTIAVNDFHARGHSVLLKGEHQQCVCSSGKGGFNNCFDLPTDIDKSDTAQKLLKKLAVIEVDLIYLRSILLKNTSKSHLRGGWWLALSFWLRTHLLK